MKYCSSCGGEVRHEIPAGDNRERAVCPACDTIHYRNPLIVVGCVPERDGQVLLCRRAIEPRRGYWTVPAGFMELRETMAEGAARETLEEACAEVEIGRLFAAVDVLGAGQVHMFYTATLKGDFGVGEESLEVRLFDPSDIPWDDISFMSVRYALETWVADAGRDNGVHTHTIRRNRPE